MAGSSSRKPALSSPTANVPFLLSQLGAHVSSRFGERIGPLGFKRYHAGVLSLLATHAGITQQALADLLGIFPSRLVGLLDELAALKLIERRKSPSDRRTYALHLTKAGRDACLKIEKLAKQLQDDICAALEDGECELLAELLTRIVAQQKITPGVHPAYRQLDGVCGEEINQRKKR